MHIYFTISKKIFVRDSMNLFQNISLKKFKTNFVFYET